MAKVAAWSGWEGHPTQGMGPAARLRCLARWLLHCHERTRQRRQLAELEPRLRADIGVTGSDITAELDKPFWR